MLKLPGIMPAMVTPFTKGGKSVDYEKACAVAEDLVKRGAHGLYVAGTTGEGMLMTTEERKKLLEEVVRCVGKKCNVVAQTGCIDTATTIDLSRHAFEAGAKAVGVVAPYFYGYDEEALKGHYRAIARAAGGPVLLYDIPSCTGNELSVDLIVELVESEENIIGMKESHRDIIKFNQLAMRLPKHFNLINGCDEYSYQAYLSGGTGSVSGTANVVLELILGVYENVQKKDLKKAAEFQGRLNQACAVLAYGRLIARFKEGARLRGVDAGYVRPPQRELSAKEKRDFAAALQKARVIK
ncbi:MAG: dihydrodipicolinate synthase family protein [Candidatus Hydrogenedentales bacterium]